MASPSSAKSPARLDLIGKRILRNLADHLEVDAAAMARALGASEAVVRARVEGMREAGLLQGYAVRVDGRRLGESFEFLVSGAPTARTDRAALARLCADPHVSRAFGLASAQSVAFTVVGRDAAAARARGMELAAQAGLMDPQAVMVVATFEDRATSAAMSLLAGAAQAAEAAADAALEEAPVVALKDDACAGLAAEPVAA